MRLDKETISETIGGNRRFISPYDEPEPYYILDGTDPLNQEFDIEIINRYYERLRYAVANADELIKAAFDDRFYDERFIDKNVVNSPSHMCDGLIFDSFVMYPDHQTIGACLSNEEFMRGHFIDVTWNGEWELISIWID